VTVDRFEVPHDVIVVAEAANRPELANAAMKALLSVEVMTDSADLLPVQDGVLAASIKRVKNSGGDQNGPTNQETR
jgi:hypothetical protein